MEKRDDFSNKRITDLVFLTKVLLIVVGLLTAVPALYNWMYDGYKIICVWSAVLLFCICLRNKKYYKKIEYIVLIIFWCMYLLTIIYNIKNHFINELLIVAYLFMMFFLLTYCDRCMSQNTVKKQLYIMAWIIVVITMIFTIINLVIYVISVGFNVDFSDSQYFYGMVEGQLGGIYNPNTGATINYISCIISLILIKIQKKNKILLITNIILELMCFSLVQSRGAWICGLTYIVIYSVFVMSINYGKFFKSFMVRLGVCCVVCILLAIGSITTRKIISNTTIKFAQVEGYVDKEHNIKVERQHKNNDSVEEFSTGRSVLWKVGLDAYKDKPILGIGYRSIDDKFAENLSEWQYKNSANGGLHNVYITVLVASGAVGFILFVLFLILIILKVLKLLIHPGVPKYVKCLVTFIPTFLVGELAESRIMFGTNIIAVLFWIIVGYTLYFSGGKRRNGKCDYTCLQFAKKD